MQPTAAATSGGGDDLHPLLYVLWQYGGTLLGVTACAGTALLYNQEDEWRAQRLLVWLFMAMVGLAVHETRPYKVGACRPHCACIAAAVPAAAPLVPLLQTCHPGSAFPCMPMTPAPHACPAPCSA